MESYFLTDSQIHEFDTAGFLGLTNQIDQNLVTLLDTAASKLIGLILEPPEQSLTNIAYAYTNGTKLVSRANNLLSFMQPEFLALMGSPQLLGVAYALCGENALPTYESLMVRTLGDNTHTGLHQDMIHDRTSRIPTFCVYLDEATPNDGSVRVIPKTQHEKHDLNQFDEHYKINQWKFKDLPAQAGDLLLHDAMILHDSPALTQRKQRRTLYFEFRAYEHLESNPRYSREWIEKRIELMEIAKRKYSDFLMGNKLVITENEKPVLSTLYSTQIQIEPANYPVFRQKYKG